MEPEHQNTRARKRGLLGPAGSLRRTLYTMARAGLTFMVVALTVGLRLQWRDYRLEGYPRWLSTMLWIVGSTLAFLIMLGVITFSDITPQSASWQWLQLLIVPAVIALVGIWFNRQQRNRELRIADERARESTLEAFLEHMATLLASTERPLYSERPGSSLSSVARARALEVLSRLDPKRRGDVLAFLYRAGLIKASGTPPVIDLSDATLTSVTLANIDLSQITLPAANLQKALLHNVDLRSSFLAKSVLSKAVVSRTDFGSANLSYANLSKAWLIRVAMRRASLVNANLSKALIFGGLDDRSMKGLDPKEAEDLREADLRGANLSSVRLLSVTLQGADLSGVTLRKAFLKDCDLSEVVLSEADCREAILWDSDLSGATLQNANLAGAFSYNLNLKDANLTSADLSEADLTSADLSEADLTSGLPPGRRTL